MISNQEDTSIDVWFFFTLEYACPNNEILLPMTNTNIMEKIVQILVIIESNNKLVIPAI